jgi:hypothetical protein
MASVAMTRAHLNGDDPVSDGLISDTLRLGDAHNSDDLGDGPCSDDWAVAESVTSQVEAATFVAAMLAGIKARQFLTA